MALSIDYRTGSKELAPYFQAYGIQAQVKKLDFGDFEWEGSGPRGRCAVAVERKRIEELMQSIESRRLSGHQLPGMTASYDYCYLVIEGLWRPGPEGQLQLGKGGLDGEANFGGRWLPSYERGMAYRSVDNYLATLELLAGVVCRRTLTAQETVAMVVDLYHWWEKPWESHRSHLGVYAPAAARGGGRLNLARRKVSVAEKIAMQLPGLDTKAQLVAEHFRTARNMANASESEWKAIKGIGKVTAKEVVEAWNVSI